MCCPDTEQNFDSAHELRNHFFFFFSSTNKTHSLEVYGEVNIFFIIYIETRIIFNNLKIYRTLNIEKCCWNVKSREKDVYLLELCTWCYFICHRYIKVFILESSTQLVKGWKNKVYRNEKHFSCLVLQITPYNN